MKIKDKIMLDRRGLTEHGPINIVIFGDSVSHGAVIENIDHESVYHNRLRKKLNAYRDYIPVNMINASIGGATAMQSLPRLDRQVLKHEPDLVIVSFGLNDVNKPLEDYLFALKTIFEKCRTAGSDVIFMTPNMLNTYVASGTPERFLAYAEKTAVMQTSGKMDNYISAAIALAEEMNVPVCNCYAKWKELSKSEDTTMLLANRINHPLPEMHELFAQSLYNLIIGEEQDKERTETTMFSE